MSRRPTVQRAEQVAVRLPAELLAEIDAHAAAVRAQVAMHYPGVIVSRGEVIRSLLIAGLDTTAHPAEAR